MYVTFYWSQKAPIFIKLHTYFAALDMKPPPCIKNKSEEEEAKV